MDPPCNDSNLRQICENQAMPFFALYLLFVVLPDGRGVSPNCAGYHVVTVDQMDSLGPTGWRAKTGLVLP